MTVPLRNNNRYNRLQREDDDEGNTERNTSTNSVEDRLLSTSTSVSPTNTMCLSTPIINGGTINITENNVNTISIYILDTVQNKFKVTCDPTITISEFKEYTSNIHHVPPASQRLVFMGRLLSDDERLCDAKISDESIIHLFPKPNIVISHSSEEAGGGVSNQEDTEHRAHIPQIVLDIEEARRNQSMSVLLTSSEMFEAQHRVKLLAFLLLIICSMELLTLLTIMLGVPTQDQNDIPPGDPTDIPFSPTPPNQVEMREWRNSDYIDLAISAFGFYVATLGIKATTDNTLRTAKRYYKGLIMTGLAWIGYYYYINVDDARQRQQQQSQHTNNTIDDSTNSTTVDNNDPFSNNYDENTNIYMEGFYGIMFPVFIWSMCFVRAWQFQTLIAEAEMEMQSRFDEILGQQQQQQGQERNTSSSAVGEDLRLHVEDETHSIV